MCCRANALGALAVMVALLSHGSGLLRGQTEKKPPAVPANYDESQVGLYTLPDPLVLENGQPVQDARTWYAKRRPEILSLFETNMHGRMPGRPGGMTFDVFDKGTSALDGQAVRKQITIYFSAAKGGPKMDLLLYLPASAPKPAPVLLCLNFLPNSSMVDDPGVKPGLMWNREHQQVPVPATVNTRLGRVPVEKFLAHGFGVAMVYYGDIEPDFASGISHGVRQLYRKPGQSGSEPDEWGAVAAWAWGLSRAMDYLETDKSVDAARVGIFGVSRLGKTVLWAGAHDTRFALVIASCSGEGGASLSRRNYGETVKHINLNFPYWFNANYQRWGDHVGLMPVEANLLLALIAPRPLFLQTGDQDKWGDPKGEFLALAAVDPVYRLLGKQGLGVSQMPPAGQAIMHTTGYYMHAGGHGTIPADFNEFLKFLQMHWNPHP